MRKEKETDRIDISNSRTTERQWHLATSDRHFAAWTIGETSSPSDVDWLTSVEL
jgi:hypothetical protein